MNVPDNVDFQVESVDPVVDEVYEVTVKAKGFVELHIDRLPCPVDYHIVEDSYALNNQGHFIYRISDEL